MAKVKGNRTLDPDEIRIEMITALEDLRINEITEVISEYLTGSKYQRTSIDASS